MDREEEDVILRDLLISSAIEITPEMEAQAEKEALWFKIEDDKIVFSHGFVEFFKENCDG